MANNGATRRKFAADVSIWLFNSEMGGNWIRDIASVTDDADSPSRIFKHYNQILDEALATKNPRAIDEANLAISRFKAPEKMHFLVGYFDKRTPAERSEYLAENSPSTVGRDAAEKLVEPLKPIRQIANYLDNNLSTSSKIFLGAATLAVGATLVCTGLGLGPFLASPLGVAFTVGLKGYGAVKALVDFTKEISSLPKSITKGFEKHSGDANYEGFPLTKKAEGAWAEAQSTANRIEDPVARNKALLTARIKCGKESHAEITKELKGALEDDPNPSMIDKTRWRLMLSDQSPSQLRDIVNIMQEKKQSRSVNKFALQDAIEQKVNSDPDFASKASAGYIGTKLAVKAAAATAPLVVPNWLGEAGEHKTVEMVVDAGSFVLGQFMERKLEERRKESVLDQSKHQSLPSSRHAPA